MDWTIDLAAAFAIEAVRFAIGDALRNVGAYDSNYLGIEIEPVW